MGCCFQFYRKPHSSERGSASNPGSCSWSGATLKTKPGGLSPCRGFSRLACPLSPTGDRLRLFRGWKNFHGNRLPALSFVLKQGFGGGLPASAPPPGFLGQVPASQSAQGCLPSTALLFWVTAPPTGLYAPSPQSTKVC